MEVQSADAQTAQYPVIEIFKEFTIEAAHRLPQVPRGHRCARVHGHSYRIEVHVRGTPDPSTGWLIDFQEVSDAFSPLRDQLDHQYLNDVPGLENPTSEMLAAWIWDRLQPKIAGLASVVVRETDSSGCIYRGIRNEAPA